MKTALVVVSLAIAAVAAAQDLPAVRSQDITVYANDRRFSDAAKTRYAGQRVSGEYRVHLDANGQVVAADVVTSIEAADEAVRQHLLRYKFKPPGRATTIFIMPVELNFVAPLPDGQDGQYRAMPSELIDKQVVTHPNPLLTPAVRKRAAGKTLTGTYLVYIERDGSVSRVDVTQSIAGADDAIAATLKQWKYAPQPERIRTMERLTFKVER